MFLQTGAIDAVGAHHGIIYILIFTVVKEVYYKKYGIV